MTNHPRPIIQPGMTAPFTVAAAEQRFTDFTAAWKGKYPAMVGMWERSWPEFTPFLALPVEIRKLIYTTDESVNGPAAVSLTISSPSSAAAFWSRRPQPGSRLAVGHPEGVALTSVRTGVSCRCGGRGRKDDQRTMESGRSRNGLLPSCCDCSSTGQLSA